MDNVIVRQSYVKTNSKEEKYGLISHCSFDYSRNTHFFAHAHLPQTDERLISFIFPVHMGMMRRKNSNLFLPYSRFLLPSFPIPLLLLLILLSLSPTLHVHVSLSLSLSLLSTKITRRRSGLRFWLSASFSLSSTCFFFDSTRKN